jgi:nucleotide sugar dehydrogenase
VVGGLTPACSLAAAAFYERFVPKVEIVSSPRTAEFAKLLENTYRLVNIALVNEVAALCSQVGVDPWEVVRAAATKPFGFAPFWPGPGVGGHCIPVDPVYLNEYATRQTGRPLPILDTALATVRALPERVADKAIAAIGLDGAAGARVLLLGVTYKPNVADTRETPAAPLARHLVARGVRVAFHDPLVRRWDFGDGPVQSVDDAALPGAVRDAALVILLQPHAAYRLPTLLAEAKQVLDTRGVLAPSRGVMRL